jgi:hypothetical protein
MFDRISKLILPHREIIMDGDAGLQPSRRSFLKGVGAVTATGLILSTPSVVRATSLMNIRGEPMRLVDFIPCDGRLLRDDFDKELAAAIGQTETGWDDEMNVYGPMRRYGGSVEQGTFAVPDFSQFDGALAPGSRYEIDHAGQLYVLADAKASDYADLSLTFSPQQAIDLIAGKRVKL